MSKATNPLTVTIQLDTLTLKSRPQDSGTRAEPYLFVVFFRFDGSTVRIQDSTTLVGDADFHLSPIGGEQKSLGPANRMDKNDTIPIPPRIGRFLTPIVPIRIPNKLTASDISPAIGVIYCLMEWDLSGERAVTGAHQEFNKRIIRILNNGTLDAVNRSGIDFTSNNLNDEQKRVIERQLRLEVIPEAISTALRSAELSTLVNKDDLLGAAGHVFSSIDFNTNASLPILKKFTAADTNNRGEWEVRGHAFRQ